MSVLIYALGFITICLSSAVSGQFMNCDWVLNRDCSVYPPIQECGTDGKSYSNICTFSKAHCNNHDLHITNHGPCTTPKPATTTPQMSTKPASQVTPTFDPNPTTKDPQQPITITPVPHTTANIHVHGQDAVLDFFCTQLSHRHCETAEELVCASDGRTYHNYYKVDSDEAAPYGAASSEFALTSSSKYYLHGTVLIGAGSSGSDLFVSRDIAGSISNVLIAMALYHF